MEERERVHLFLTKQVMSHGYTTPEVGLGTLGWRGMFSIHAQTGFYYIESDGNDDDDN